MWSAKWQRLERCVALLKNANCWLETIDAKNILSPKLLFSVKNV